MKEEFVSDQTVRYIILIHRTLRSRSAVLSLSRPQGVWSTAKWFWEDER